MIRQPLIVLKFGGSVLDGDPGLRRAACEIYRWRREGWRVVAVVSALAGRTDRLLSDCDGLGARDDSPARAALVATGEAEAGARLHLQLERAGLPAGLVEPGAGGIVAAGDPLDARPLALRGDGLWRQLDRHGVAVLPGYVGTTAEASTVVLGRGGSDLSALFVAAELGADRCRLIKDVDGLYTADPAGPGPRPPRYATATYADALATDGSIIQHKAVAFAQRRGLVFELGGFNAEAATTIGSEATHLEAAPAAPDSLRVGLLGHGVVGAGVAALLDDHRDRFRLDAVCVRDVARHRELPRALLVTDPLALADRRPDVVVEVLGGIEAPLAAARAVLGRGIDLVTANKALLARHGTELRALAERHGCSLRAAAAVGGSVPVLEALVGHDAHAVTEVSGILCGTANYVLERLDAGLDLDTALSEARDLGYAEADAARDLDGRDAADKLCVMASALGGPELRPEDVTRESIGASPHRTGVRQVASLQRREHAWRASVRLTAPPPDSRLAGVRRNQNAVVIRTSDERSRALLGDGAGRWPTANSVLADLLDLWRDRAHRRREIVEVA